MVVPLGALLSVEGDMEVSERANAYRRKGDESAIFERHTWMFLYAACVAY